MSGEILRKLKDYKTSVCQFFIDYAENRMAGGMGKHYKFWSKFADFWLKL